MSFINRVDAGRKTKDMGKKYISVVIPVYGCKGALHPLHDRLVQTLTKITDSFEIILVNDACPQNSWEIIQEICAKDERVIGINLSRNFGQIKAITAGLDRSCGEWVVVMDCDLQDRPEGIIDLYNEAMKGYDIVFAKRLERQDSAITKFLSKSFYKVYDYFTDGNYDASICNFNISKRIVIDNYCKMREQNRGFTIFLKWLGFKQSSIDVAHDSRAEGKSSYNFRKKIKMAIEFITAQSNKPLRFAMNIGFLMALLSFCILFYYIIHYFISGAVPVGWTTLIVSIYFIGGLILMTLGIVGLYIGNIFNESKHRPLYVVRDVLNGKEEE